MSHSTGGGRRRIQRRALTFLVVSALLTTLRLAAAEESASTRERVLALTESLGHQVDAAERDHYGLFPDCNGFLQAEFLLRDGSYWLRLTYHSGTDRIVEQSSVTEAQFLAWRDAVLAVDRGRPVTHVALSANARRDGRLRMVTDVFLYGLGLYGPATISLFDVESSQGSSAIELLAGGGAFAGALYRTQDYRLGHARTTMVRWGNYTGTFYGVGLPALLNIHNERAYALSVMTTTPIGGYLAYRWRGDLGFSKGEADLIASGTWVGALYGLALPYLAGADGDWGRVYLGSAMVGAPTGALLAATLADGQRLNRGRSHLILLGGIVGVAEALSVIDLVDDKAPFRALAWGAVLGAPTGAWLACRATRDRNHTLGRARMISVGTYAGGLAGQGVVLSLGLNGSARTAARMIGATTGLWFTDRLTQDWGDEAGAMPVSAAGLRVELPSPAALLALGAVITRGPVGATLPPVPLLRLSF